MGCSEVTLMYSSTYMVFPPHPGTGCSPSQFSISVHAIGCSSRQKNRRPWQDTGSGPWRALSQAGRISVSRFSPKKVMSGITPAPRLLSRNSCPIPAAKSLQFASELDGNRNLSHRMSKMEILYCFTALPTMGTHL